jgi:excisionase family DNA binding protein
VNNNDRLTLEQMAERLQTSAKTFSKDVKEKGIPFYPVGKRMRFDPYEVEAYLRTTETPVTSNVIHMPVTKRKPGKVVSPKFAEAR